MSSGRVLYDTAFECDAELRFYQFARSVCTAKPNLLLHCRSVEDLVGMRRGCKPPHRFNHDRAADSIVPTLTRIVIRAVHHKERRIGNHGIAGLDSELSRFGFCFRANIEKDRVSWIDSGSLFRRNHMNVADSGDRSHRPL